MTDSYPTILKEIIQLCSIEIRFTSTGNARGFTWADVSGSMLLGDVDKCWHRLYKNISGFEHIPG
jgi:hypothetical protein